MCKFTQAHIKRPFRSASFHAQDDNISGILLIQIKKLKHKKANSAQQIKNYKHNIKAFISKRKWKFKKLKEYQNYIFYFLDNISQSQTGDNSIWRSANQVCIILKGACQHSSVQYGHPNFSNILTQLLDAQLYDDTNR